MLVQCLCTESSGADLGCILELLLLCSNNQNSAHASDVFNPDWYVQTPPVRLNITTDTVSQTIQSFLKKRNTCTPSPEYV